LFVADKKLRIRREASENALQIFVVVVYEPGVLCQQNIGEYGAKFIGGKGSRDAVLLSLDSQAVGRIYGPE